MVKIVISFSKDAFFDQKLNMSQIIYFNKKLWMYTFSIKIVKSKFSSCTSMTKIGYSKKI